MGVVDWDNPQSWLHDDALRAIEQLCQEGEADVPVYDIAHDGRTGHARLELGDAAYFIAEGIFAQEIVAQCAARGLLADAICVRHHRLVTFWRRLTRDLKERRKPPHVLVRRGLMLLKLEPQVVAHAVELGCTPMTPDQAYRRITRLVGSGVR
jgi:uridine kinase